MDEELVANPAAATGQWRQIGKSLVTGQCSIGFVPPQEDLDLVERSSSLTPAHPSLLRLLAQLPEQSAQA